MGKPRVGIVGAGQLGRMMALAAYPLGIECRFLDTHANSPGGQLAPIHVAALDDPTALQKLAAEVDVLTFDIENVSVAALERLQTDCPVHPNPAIVARAQDRLAEKQMFESLGIPTANHTAIDSPDDFDKAVAELGLPIVLKARRLGYDGRGQRIVTAATDFESAWADLGRVPAIAEGWVEFVREVSLIGVSNGKDDARFYPLTENRHRDGMLESSLAPFADAALQHQAEEWMAAMFRTSDYCGVLTIEFFQTSNGLIANEIAPRVHNSGHWTIEGSETSQFENHIRAVAGLPLGTTSVRGIAAMRNLIGSVPDAHSLLSIPGLHLHDYGKTARPGRKVGHCTLVAENRESVEIRLEALENVLKNSLA